MWLTEEFRPIDELERASERALAIIAAALVDSELSEIVRSQFKPNDSAYATKIRKTVFGAEGPLGNAGSKIHVAYLMGYLTEDGHSDLCNIASIRNLFAHYAEHHSFAGQSVSDKCKNFRRVDSDILPSMAVTTLPDGTKMAMESVSVQDRVRLHTPDADVYTKNPKGRFVGTAKLFVAAAFVFRDAAKAPLRKPFF